MRSGGLVIAQNNVASVVLASWRDIRHSADITPREDVAIFAIRLFCRPAQADKQPTSTCDKAKLLPLASIRHGCRIFDAGPEDEPQRTASKKTEFGEEIGAIHRDGTGRTKIVAG